MKLGSFYGTGYINEGAPLQGRLKVTQERIDISTNSPKSDRTWTFVDGAGHFHAWSDGEYPTLVRKYEHRDCDGSCGGVCDGEGFDVTVYTCMLCREVVVPGVVPGPHFKTMPGMFDWSALLEGDSTDDLERLAGTLGSSVMLRFEATHPEPWLFFGPAVIGDTTITGGFGDRPRVSLSLYAAGKLGDRPPLSRVENAA